MKVTVVMVADIPYGAQSAFQAYESKVLPLLARHGGTLERRLRTDDALNEVHVVSFTSQAGCERTWRTRSVSHTEGFSTASTTFSACFGSTTCRCR